MAELIPKAKVVDFYNRFSAYQKRSGVNVRIRSIMRNLKGLGLPRDSKILEVGCGVGFLTRLLAQHFSRGSVVATEISESGIEAAKASCSGKSNVRFVLTGDLSKLGTESFDLVIFADVLEHIPLQEHEGLFQGVHQLTHSKSVVAINIPSPFHIRHLKKAAPQQLQIIDQALETDSFLPAIYQGGFYLHELKTYSLYFKGGDYQWLLLKRQDSFADFKSKSSLELKVQELTSKLGLR